MLGTSTSGSVSSSSRITKPRSTWSCSRSISTTRTATRSSRAKWVGPRSCKASEWSDEVDALLADEATSDQAEESIEESEQPEGVLDGFEDHSLYRAAFALTVRIDQLFDENPALQNEPSAVKLATHSALASAKLAAALSDDDVDEIGMTIAYLKRSLKAITVSMEAGRAMLAERLITSREHSVLEQRLFQVRDGIITLMGEYRGEWLRRFGSL